METEHSTDSPAAAGDIPRWVMLNRYSYRQFADAKTTSSAASHTSTGHLFRVSFRLAAPPACSSFHSDWAGSDDEPHTDPQIVAAHSDCLLLDVTCPNPNKLYDTVVKDYFLYEAGGATRPPSLTLLPACFLPTAFWRGKDTGWRATARQRYLGKDDTGILRRDTDEIMVAHLEVPENEDWKFREKAELCVLDMGRLEWELQREVPIIHGGATAGNAEKLMQWWTTDVAVPVGNRFLCFVDYYRGFLLLDMATAALELQYVPLPLTEEPPDWCPTFGDPRCPQNFRNIAMAGADAIRFVTIESRCCCGGAGDSTCEDGRFLFTVTMWTLNLATDNEAMAAAWVKDGVLDCEEIWAMPGYGSLPRRPLSYPVISCDDPDIVCFMVRSGYRYGGNRKDRKVWMLEIDTRSKTLRSVALYNNVEEQAEHQVAVKLQC